METEIKMDEQHEESTELLLKVAEKPAPCCPYRSVDSFQEETDFLMSIPRHFRPDARRPSSGSLKEGVENEDLSTQVEVASVPEADRTETASIEDQCASSTDQGEDSRSENPVTVEPVPDRGTASSFALTSQCGGTTEASDFRSNPCGNFNCSIVCEAADNMASDNYLRDYYDQLPPQTVPDFLESVPEQTDVTQDYDSDDVTSVLQPEVLSHFDSSQETHVKEDVDQSDLTMGGEHPSFEPAPAASFEPEPVIPVSPIVDTPSPVPADEEIVSEDGSFGRELENSRETIASSKSDVEPEKMSSEQEMQTSGRDGQEESDQEKAEDLQPIEEVKTPEEEVSLNQQSSEDVTPADDIKQEQDYSRDVKEEVAEISAPVVEEIDTKPEPVPSILSQCPAAAVEAKVLDADQDPVIDLIYWRDVKKTAVVFSTIFVILVSLTAYSIISVISYSGLALLTVTVAFRLYKVVLQTLNGTQQPHPFQEILDADIAISQERIQRYSSAFLVHLNCCISSARDLFLVKNTISSLKFGVFLWLMTYIGCCFNGLTLLIIDICLLFAVPPVYEKYQTQIDNYCGIARQKVTAALAAAKAKLPGQKQAKEKAQ